MKTLFGLQADDYNYLPTEVLFRKGDISKSLLDAVIAEILRNHKASQPVTGDVNQATRRVFISSDADLDDEEMLALFQLVC